MTGAQIRGLIPSSVLVFEDDFSPGSAARRFLNHLISGGFPGRIRQIKLSSGTDLTDSFDTSPDAPLLSADLAAVAVSGPLVLSAMRRAHRYGVSAIVILTPPSDRADFPPREILLEFCARRGILLLGPGSLGFAAPDYRLNASLMPQMPPEGGVALLAQSPSLLSRTADAVQRLGLGFSLLANTVSGDISPVLDRLAEDFGTRVIAVHLENAARPAEFLTSLRNAAEKKRVVVLRQGAGSASAGIAASMLGTAFTDFRAFDAAVRRTGALLVHDFRDFASVIRAFSEKLSLRGNRAVCFADDPYTAIELCELAESAGLALPRAPEGFSKIDSDPAVRHPVLNPVLFNPETDPAEQASVIRRVTLSHDADAALILTRATGSALQRLEDSAKSISAQTGKPVILTSGDPAWQLAASSGTPFWKHPEAAVSMLSILASHKKETEKRHRPDTVSELLPEALVSALEREAECAAGSGSFRLFGRRASGILARLSVPVSPEFEAADASGAESAAAALGYPVRAGLIVNGMPPAVTKTVSNAASLRTFCEEEERRIRRTSPCSVIHGIGIQAAGSAGSADRTRVSFRHLQGLGLALTVARGGKRSAPVLLPLTGNLVLDSLEESGIRIGRALLRALLRISALFEAAPAFASLQAEFEETPEGVRAFGPVIAVSAKARRGRFAFRPVPKDQSVFQTRRGELRIRCVTPADREKLAALFSRLSPESVRLRFHSATDSLTERQLTAFSSYDPALEIAYAAESSDGAFRAVARARKILDSSDPPAAEFALVAEDGWQRLGLGSRMLSALETGIRHIGCGALKGIVLTGNGAMTQLALRRGFRCTFRDTLAGTSTYIKTIEPQHDDQP